MSKRKFSLISSGTVATTGRDICFLCQQNSREKLICPSKSTQKDKYVGYKTLVDDLLQFASNGLLDLSLNRLVENENSVLETLISKQASFHKTCRNHLQRKSEELKNVHENAEDENCVINSAEPSDIKRRRSTRQLNSIEKNCLFCNREDSKENLGQVMTFKLDLRVRHGAKLLNDFDISTKIGDGDMVAMEKKYYNHCLCAFYKRVNNVTKNEIQMENDNNSVFYGTVSSEVINHIKKTFETSTGSHPIFLLAELRELFNKTYQRYTNEVYSVHHTRFRNDLLKNMPSLTALKNIVLTTNDSTMETFFENLERCREDDGKCLLKAAKIIRQDLFGSNSLFNGNFHYSSQELSVSKSLLVLFRMILEGTNISSESSYATNQVALSLAQLIKFNSVKRKRRETTICPCHKLSQKTPLPVYLGLMIHSKTRMKGVIEKLATLDLSIAYNRVSEIQQQVVKQEIK